VAMLLVPAGHEVWLAATLTLTPTIRPARSNSGDPELPLSRSHPKVRYGPVLLAPPRRQNASAGCRDIFLLAARGWWMAKSGSPSAGFPPRRASAGTPRPAPGSICTIE